MSKCKKAKNPCKICFGPVTNKTGLQCCGACECWIHYACLNYTPGKLKDIKAGIIKVTCPCPDCKTTMPKEHRTDEPYSCSNLACPANQPPRCEVNTCPINVENPPPLTKCGAQCKKHTVQTEPGSPGSPRAPGVVPHGQADSPARAEIPNCLSSSADIPGDYGVSPMEGMPSLRALEQMCNTVGQLTNQLNSLMTKMTQALHERSGGGGRGVNPRNYSQMEPKSECPKPCYCPGNPKKKY